MRARPGDRIILASPTIDGPVRDGEVLETRGDDGEPPYVVRWSDGHEGLLYPGPGSVLRVTSHGSADAAEPAPSLLPPSLLPPKEPKPRSHGPSDGTPHVTGAHPRVRDWQVRISIFGSDDDAEASVVLLADSPTHLTAHGHSHRSLDDRGVPEIGDEVAVARALRRLADQLLETAAEDIEAVTGEHDVSLRSR
jgi:hypothetical protein